jgi:hypothetical protein
MKPKQSFAYINVQQQVVRVLSHEDLRAEADEALRTKLWPPDTTFGNRLVFLDGHEVRVGDTVRCNDHYFVTGVEKGNLRPNAEQKQDLACVSSPRGDIRARFAGYG